MGGCQMKSDRRPTGTWIPLSLLLLAGCTLTTPTPTAPSPPTPTPTLTPTSTPLPPVPLTIRWSEAASALSPVTVEAELPGLPERDPAARVRAVVVGPHGGIWWRSGLEPVGEGRYAAPVPLHLPLEPPAGDWRLIVLVETTAAVGGEHMLRFRPAEVPLHDLSDQTPQGLELGVPQALPETHAEGDRVAGARAWSAAGGEVGLWWVPGPDEPLTQDTAQVMVEATYPADVEVETTDVEPVEWQSLSAFRFEERWPTGPAEALVVQGPDRWLYLLRVRALSEEAVPPLLWDIQATLKVTE